MCQEAQSKFLDKQFGKERRRAGNVGFLVNYTPQKPLNHV